MPRNKRAVPLICIIAENDSDRERIDSLIRATGHKTSVFDSGEAFLRSYHDEKIGCLIFDERLPGLSGPRLQRLLANAHISIPIVFVMSRAGVMRAPAPAEGAVTVLGRSFTDEDLLRAVRSALESPEVD
jgi:FixJ family two-component response regulator